MTKRVRFFLDPSSPAVHSPRTASAFVASSILAKAKPVGSPLVRAHTIDSPNLSVKSDAFPSPQHITLPTLPKQKSGSKSRKAQKHKSFPSPSHFFSQFPSFVSHHLNPAMEVRLHHLLTFWPAFYPGVDYDVSLPSSTAIAPKYPAHALLEPATNPPVKMMTIQHPLLLWDIVASPHTPSAFYNAKHRPGREFVSVLDVLAAIFHTLNIPIDHTEYALTRDQTRVNAAYYARCDRIGDPVARIAESERGVRRVDFLTGKNTFEGLVGPRDGNKWDLRVS